MVWVKSELAEELAVVAAWLSAVVPWSASVALGTIQGGTLVEIRFPFGLVRYLFGIEFEGQLQPHNPQLMTPWRAAEYYVGAPGALPYRLWLLAAGIIALAVVLSFLLYGFEDRLAESRLDPVRVMGGLLLLSAVLLTLSTVVLQFGGGPLGDAMAFPGFVLPVGVVIQYAFAYILLRVERREGTDADDGNADPTGNAS
jgi:uncharacterized protein (TIGR04206 family)